MVYCIAEFEAKENKEDELFHILQGLEEKTHKEKGCITYKVMKKIKNEYAQGEHKGIIFNESWDTVEDFNKHNQAKHITDFFEEQCLKETGLVKSWNVNLFEV